MCDTRLTVVLLVFSMMKVRRTPGDHNTKRLDRDRGEIRRRGMLKGQSYHFKSAYNFHSLFFQSPSFWRIIFHRGLMHMYNPWGLSWRVTLTLFTYLRELCIPATTRATRTSATWRQSKGGCGCWRLGWRQVGLDK